MSTDNDKQIKPTTETPKREECQARASGYGCEGYPCHRIKGHSGPHEILDKDDCPHQWGGARTTAETPKPETPFEAKGEQAAAIEASEFIEHLADEIGITKDIWIRRSTRKLAARDAKRDAARDAATLQMADTEIGKRFAQREPSSMAWYEPVHVASEVLQELALANRDALAEHDAVLLRAIAEIIKQVQMFCDTDDNAKQGLIVTILALANRAALRDAAPKVDSSDTHKEGNK